MDTSVEKRWADGVYRFWLPLPQAIEIERKCGMRGADGAMVPKSIFTIYDQLGGGLTEQDDIPGYFGGGAALIGDARAVVLAGLIGGNHGVVDGEQVEVGPVRAGELLDAYTFPARPAIEIIHLAWHILHAAIIGIDVKKKDEPAPEQKPKRSVKAR